MAIVFAILSKTLLIAGVMVLAGCGETSSSLSPTAPASAIIVLPGYYGTRLAQVRDHDLVWISTWEALFGSRSLVLPLSRLGLSEGIELEAAGILSEVPVLPFYSVDAYGTLLDTLRRMHGRHSMIVPLAYDWRGDVLEVVKHLHHTVTDLRHQGVNRIGLVAHSMGGLIAAYYLRYGPQELGQAVEDWAGAAQMDAVVLAGVPYGGSMFTFRNMQYGRKIGLNKALLSSEAVASFPSSYYILPSPDLDVLLSASLDPLRGMIYDSARWKENEWGLSRGSSRFSHEILSNRLEYTEYWLARAARLFHLVQAPLGRSSPAPVRALSIIGQGQETLATGVWMGRQSAPAGGLLFDEEQFETFRPDVEKDVRLENGDGTVTVIAASLPQAYSDALAVRHRQVSLSHGDLVTDPDMVEEIAAFMADAMDLPASRR